MAFDNRRTYLCYNNKNLTRDGYIPTIIEKEYIPVGSFNISRLTNPQKGVTYIVTRDPGTQEITAVKERRKLLPANKIKVEIDFSKVMKNSVVHILEPGSVGFSPIANSIATFLLAPMGMGGITSGLTDITFQLLDSEQKINYPITVTKEILDTGVIVLEDYPLSIFGIVKESIIKTTETVDNEDGSKTTTTTERKVGLDFTEDQLKVLGKFSDGVWKGSRRKRVDGATDSDGLFGGKGDAEVKFEDVKLDDQEQLFIEIIKDERKTKFRGDNSDASGGKDYPFITTGTNRIDATDHQIRLNVSNLKLKDTIYMTYSFSKKRHVRQNLTHKGTVAQGNTVGVVGWMGAIASEVSAWDYQISEWKVPVLPPSITMKNIDEIGTVYNFDDDYKLSLSEYSNVKINEDNDKDISNLADTLEGWRLSESINDRIEKFWAADYRGILFFDDKKITIVHPYKNIRDREWFLQYLKDLPFTSPTGPVDSDGIPTYLPSDLEKKIEDYFDIDESPGLLFDLSEITNSMFFDREKYPYYRPFANALKLIDDYDSEDKNSGIGIVNLDLLSLSNFSSLDLSKYDLSFIVFKNANAQPLKNYNCEEPFDIHNYNYFSENYDAKNDGPGAWYDTGFIENEVFEWRPSGGSIESYWKVETPFFCGNFTKNSRVYIERMGGNSLDNYSWIYVDTDPFVPDNISFDSNPIRDQSFLIFNDNELSYSLSYHKLSDNLFYNLFPSLSIDESKSHIEEEYDHDKNLFIGQSKILGDSPSYSNGIPITDEILRICSEDKGAEFWSSAELLNNSNSYGLDFSSDIPKANIPIDWRIRQIFIEYYYTDEIIPSKEKYVSLYFEGTKSSISNYRMKQNNNKGSKQSSSILLGYYYGGPIQFLGEFWKKVRITRVKVRYTSVYASNNIDKLNLDDYKIEAGQSAIVYDGLGRAMVFYANDVTGNIDIAISDTDGSEWTIHKSIIRLIEGELASFPFVIQDPHSNYVFLFYILNDSFLMYRRVDSRLLITQDSFVKNKVPTTYFVGDYDQSLDNPEKEYWGNYSDSGTRLRRETSYFIAGSYRDIYFTDQLTIGEELAANNSKILKEYNEQDLERLGSGEKVKKPVFQTPRFAFDGVVDSSGVVLSMEDSYEGEAYSVSMDDQGLMRLFLVVNGRLTIKSSSNYTSWDYDIKEQIIHKTYKDDKLNKGLEEEIRNIQVVRSYYDKDIISVLYFNNGMLFIRHFSSSLLFSTYDIDGNRLDDQIKRQLELTKKTQNRPIFLVGHMPKTIRDLKIKEIDEGINDSNSSLYLQIPYSKDMIEKFDSRFELDLDTQVCSYVLTNGLIRVFYKDIFNNLNGITIDGLDDPTLEVQYVPK